MTERIGLQAILDTSQWDPAVSRFIGDQGKMLTSLTKLLLGTTAVTGGIIALAASGAKVEGLRSGFEKLGGSLIKWQNATEGMMADEAIFRTFNDAAIDLSSALANRLPEAMGFLQNKAYATGKTIEGMITSLVQAVEYGMPRSFRRLGLDLLPQKIYEETARQLRINVADLTMDQKQTALLNAALDEMQSKLGGLTDVADTAQGSILKLQASMVNMRGELGDALLPVLVAILPHMEQMVSALQKMFADPRFREGAKDLAAVLSDLLTRITEFAAANMGLLKAFGWVWVGIEGLKLMAGPLGIIVGLYSKLGLMLMENATAKAFNMAMSLGMPEATATMAGMGAGVGAAKGLVAATGVASIAITATAVYLYGLKWSIGEAEKRAATAREEAATTALAPGTPYEDYLATAIGSLKKSAYWMDIQIGYQQSGGQMLDEQQFIQQAITDKMVMTREAYADYYDIITAKSASEAEDMAQLRDMARQMAQQYVPQGAPAVAGAFVAPAASQVNPFTEAMRSGEAQALYLQTYQAIEALTATHEQNMLSIQEGYAQTRAEQLFSFQMQSTEMELDYQSRRAAMVRAGRDDMVKDLDAAHSVETSNMERQYKIQAGLTDRAMLEQRVIEAKGQVEKINAQILAYEQEIGNVLVQDRNFRELNAVQQAILLEQLGVHNAKMIIKQAQGLHAALDQDQHFGEALIENAETTWTNYILALNGKLTDADAAYKKALADFDAFSAKLIGEITPAAFDPSAYNAPINAAVDNAESATRTMADVAKDIRSSIEDAYAAIIKLATFTLPTNLKRGLDNLADYLIMATEALYAAYEAVKEDVNLSSLQEGTEHIQSIIGIIKPTIDSMVALSEYEAAADLPERMSYLADDLFLAILNINDVYRAVSTKIAGSRLVNLGSLEEGAGHINSIIGVIIPTIEALQMLGEYKTGNLVEVMDVFEADFLYVIDRIGQLADKISDIGLLKAQLFEQNAIGISSAIQSGVAAIQDSATAMIGLDTGAALLTVLGPQTITMPGLTSGSPRSYTFAIEFNNVSIGNDMDLEVVANTLADTVASKMEGL